MRHGTAGFCWLQKQLGDIGEVPVSFCILSGAKCSLIYGSQQAKSAFSAK